MTFTFSNLRLLVTNFDECFLFYRDTLGFERTDGAEGEVYASFKLGEGYYLALFRRELMAEVVGASERPSHANMQDGACLSLEVPDVDAMTTQLTERGVTFVSPPTSREEWGIRSAQFRDPAGFLLEIFTTLPQA